MKANLFLFIIGNLHFSLGFLRCLGGFTNLAEALLEGEWVEQKINMNSQVALESFPFNEHFCFDLFLLLGFCLLILNYLWDFILFLRWCKKLWSVESDFQEFPSWSPLDGSMKIFLYCACRRWFRMLSVALAQHPMLHNHVRVNLNHSMHLRASLERRIFMWSRNRQNRSSAIVSIVNSVNLIKQLSIDFLRSVWILGKLKVNWVFSSSLGIELGIFVAFAVDRVCWPSK